MAAATTTPAAEPRARVISSGQIQRQSRRGWRRPPPPRGRTGARAPAGYRGWGWRETGGGSADTGPIIRPGPGRVSRGGGVKSEEVSARGADVPARLLAFERDVGVDQGRPARRDETRGEGHRGEEQGNQGEGQRVRRADREDQLGQQAGEGEGAGEAERDARQGESGSLADHQAQDVRGPRALGHAQAE